MLSRSDSSGQKSGSTRGQQEAGKWTYAGLFMVTLATLMYEILLTRIFSVTMWYHFAFMAISVAMFGMTAGAVWVYLDPRYSEFGRTKHQMARSSLLFAIASVVCFLTQLLVPFDPQGSIIDLGLIAVIYIVISIPFVFSGISVCLALTKFPRQAGKLYAADLAGAASGCVLLIYTLRMTDASTAVVVAALVACLGAVMFATEGSFHKLRRVSAVCAALLLVFVVSNTTLVKRDQPLLRLPWVKGRPGLRPLYERWNSFSRIAVYDVPYAREKPFGWGLSPAYSSPQKTGQLFLDIDATAGTVLTRFNGNANELQYLRYDVTNVVHYLRPNSRVLVIGAGGGRDILSALAFGQKSVLALEINEDIIGALNERFGNFTGHLDRDPRVTFVNDEARSYMARSRDQFDIIHVSLIDTWAATAAGAFILTENSLYTVEAWKLFLERLTSSGVLSFSRYYNRFLPAEMYRLTSLAAASLMEWGARKPEDHIVILRCMRHLSWSGIENGPDGVATILVSKNPFSEKDLSAFADICRKMQFDLVFSPRFCIDPVFSALASGRNPDRFDAKLPFDISPPTDNHPFFFNMLRLRDAFTPAKWDQRVANPNQKAVLVLGALIVLVTFLTLLSIIGPLHFTTQRGGLRGAVPHLVFFAAIGLGFMFVEISQMQRLIVFLGHPTYGLSVVLFGLLVSSGLGSYSAQGISSAQLKTGGIARLLLLLLVLIILGVATSRVFEAYQELATAKRIMLAAGLLFPLGLCMGSAFPLGLQLASCHSAALTPWLWGINGATSVCASSLAVAIALNWGISTAYWTGLSCYAIGFAAFVWASHS